MNQLDTLTRQCTAVLEHTPDAVLMVRADLLLILLGELQRFEADMPLYEVGDPVRLNGNVVKVFGVTKAANPNDRYWYRVGTATVATQDVREGVLRTGRRRNG